MNYASKTTHSSEVMPAVSYSLKKLSHGRRVKIDLALSEYRARIRELAQKHRAIENDESAEAVLERLRLDQETSLIIEQHFKRAYIGEALAGIEGLEIDEAPATLENLLSDGPAELVQEIYDRIQANIGLNLDEIKNSERPTTSAE